MTDRTWDRGVDLELHGTGKYRTVRSTEDAARSLTERWPVGEGRAFKTAVKACIDALEDTTSRIRQERARAAFIDAAHEAGIYVRRR